MGAEGGNQLAGGKVLRFGRTDLAPNFNVGMAEQFVEMPCGAKLRDELLRVHRRRVGGTVRLNRGGRERFGGFDSLLFRPARKPARARSRLCRRSRKLYSKRVCLQCARSRALM